MDIDFLDSAINNLKRKIDTDKGKREILIKQEEEISQKLEELKSYDDVLSKVIVLFQKTSKFGREQAKSQIEDVVTKCLQFVLETDIEFKIEITESRNIPQAEFYVISNYNSYSVKTKPELSRGGGIVDIVSIALRIALIQIKKPFIEGPIIFDEPGKHVSNDYMFNLGEFLKKSSTMFRRQIIMITHNNHLSQICDKSYEVEIKNGISSVNVISDLSSDI